MTLNVINAVDYNPEQITDPKEAYDWAVYLNRPCPELEHLFISSTDVSYSVAYSKNVLKKRWIEQEPRILESYNASQQYLSSFPEVRTYSKDLPLVICKRAIIDIPNTITDEQFIKLISLTLEKEICMSNSDFIFWTRWLSEPYIRQHLPDVPQYKSHQLKEVLRDIDIIYFLFENNDFKD